MVVTERQHAFFARVVCWFISAICSRGGIETLLLYANGLSLLKFGALVTPYYILYKPKVLLSTSTRALLRGGFDPLNPTKTY